MSALMLSSDSAAFLSTSEQSIVTKFSFSYRTLSWLRLPDAIPPEKKIISGNLISFPKTN
jgi:hypothetical protein